MSNKYVQDTECIYPESEGNINYWTRKLRITRRQLNDAILYTGSIRIADIKSYLKKQSPDYFSVFGSFIKNKLIHFN